MFIHPIWWWRTSFRFFSMLSEKNLKLDGVLGCIVKSNMNGYTRNLSQYSILKQAYSSMLKPLRLFSLSHYIYMYQRQHRPSLSRHTPTSYFKRNTLQEHYKRDVRGEKVQRAPWANRWGRSRASKSENQGGRMRDQKAQAHFTRYRTSTSYRCSCSKALVRIQYLKMHSGLWA